MTGEDRIAEVAERDRERRHVLSDENKNEQLDAGAGDAVSVPSAQDVDESRLSAWCLFDTVAGGYVDATFRTREPTARQRETVEAGGLWSVLGGDVVPGRFEWHRV